MITGPGSPSVLSNMAVSIEQHVDWVADAHRRRCGPRASSASSRPTPPRRAGCSTSTTAPTSRSTRRRTRGTWAPTCPASRGCSCPTSAASTATAQICDEVVEQDFLGFELAGPGGTQVNDGVIRRLQPDVQMVLTMMAELDLPPLESMTPAEARDFMAAVRGRAPARPGRRRDRRRRAARCRRQRPRVPPVPPGGRGPAPAWSATSTAAAGCSATASPTTRSAATCACAPTP